jgi:hypothetical protein
MEIAEDETDADRYSHKMLTYYDTPWLRCRNLTGKIFVDAKMALSNNTDTGNVSNWPVAAQQLAEQLAHLRVQLDLVVLAADAARV